jgi:hypothetical protein
MNTQLKNKIISDSKINALLNANRFCEAAIKLQDRQKKEWILLLDNYSALKNVKQKSIQFNGYKIHFQFNPQRLLSSTADVSEITIKNRECFLCLNNLPKEQKGILIYDKFILLCNPFPIFNHHFTIAYTEHQPQLINNHFLDLLSLAKNMNDRFAVFYNGPKCGASAPDHLHFQTVEKKCLPIFNQLNLIKNKFGKLHKSDSNISVHSIDDGLRKFILLQSLNVKLIENYFNKIYTVLDKSSDEHSEPMLNILCTYDGNTGWTVLVFSRSQHRSSHYFSRGKSKILISPASVDVGGVCILPREEDYAKISPESLREIFSEIFPYEIEFNKIISAIA